MTSFGMLASMDFFGQAGVALALGIAAVGSAIGIGLAGQSAAGAWAKEAKAGKNLSFAYIILMGLPLSQTIYAFVVMGQMSKAIDAGFAATHGGTLLGIGLAVGLAEMLSAWMQGMIGAAGVRTMSEGDGKGLAFILIAMGIAETVGIFAMVFLLGQIPKVPEAAEPVVSWLSSAMTLIA
jgi:V/A-type H+/Na+-transporting ATPase subunit K